MQTLRRRVSMFCRPRQSGSVLVLVLISISVLFILGMSMMMTAYGVRHRALRYKNEGAAMLAAEAGYEKAIFWMTSQRDMLGAIAGQNPGIRGSLSFPEATCEYAITLNSFAGSRPIYRIISEGTSGVFRSNVDVKVIQAVSGWDMGACRVAAGQRSTAPVHFASGEHLDIPIHINDLQDLPDQRDIYLSGSPHFNDRVSMGESRHAGGSDKYAGVMQYFDAGIAFDQPDARITDDSSITSKTSRFRDSTKTTYKFRPVATAGAISNAMPAVQLEFFVSGGTGKVRITNDCTVRGFRQSSDSKTWDFRIQPGTDGERFERYYIYGYHVKNESTNSLTVNVADTYVTQKIGLVESKPGGQIFVDGNVIIGGDQESHGNGQLVSGNITVVATGNIWIADSIKVDGARDSRGLPAADNPHVLGLIAEGVVKVVDPGMSEYSYVDGQPEEPEGFKYIPIGVADEGSTGSGDGSDDDSTTHKRHLPNPMVIEAAITVGGGGWGAENVERRSGWSSYGGRKEAPGTGRQNDLVVHGTITEALRGVVGLIGQDGFLKQYYMDHRLLEGILPGDIWMSGKFIPAPAGWHDYRPDI